MPIDYNDKNLNPNIARNRPKKKSYTGIIILSTIALVSSYLIGLATGWFLFGQNPKQVTIPKPAANPPEQTAAGTPSQQGNASNQQGAPNSPPIPYTFYDTLPKGEKAVMGSGINQHLANKQDQPQVQDQAQTANQPPQAVSPQQPQSVKRIEQVKDKGGQKLVAENSKQSESSLQKKQLPAPVVPKMGKRTYSVQIASTSDRGEADGLKNRLAGKGISAFVVTFENKGKTWYRVRTGKALTEQEAKRVAATVGEKSYIVPE